LLSAPSRNKSQSVKELLVAPPFLASGVIPFRAALKLKTRATSLSNVVYCRQYRFYASKLTCMTGLITRIKAGPIPLQNPLKPSFLKISLAASTAEGLIFLSSPAKGGSAVTALVDWAVCTVQIGFVRRVVIDPAMRPAMMPSEVLKAADKEVVFGRRRMSTERSSSSIQVNTISHFIPKTQ